MALWVEFGMAPSKTMRPGVPEYEASAAVGASTAATGARLSAAAATRPAERRLLMLRSLFPLPSIRTVAAAAMALGQSRDRCPASLVVGMTALGPQPY